MALPSPLATFAILVPTDAAAFIAVFPMPVSSAALAAFLPNIRGPTFWNNRKPAAKVPTTPVANFRPSSHPARLSDFLLAFSLRSVCLISVSVFTL